MNHGYHKTRLQFDGKRKIVWGALWRFYFRKLIRISDTVVDLGSGYGDFINSVEAKCRIAVDIWPKMKEHIDPGVNCITSNLDNLDFLEDASVDFVMASNLFEHLTREHLTDLLVQLLAKLKVGGRLTVIQPNYRYAYKEYFDDYTHISVYSHVSMIDLLESMGYLIEVIEPRFLPLTVKSRLPINPLIIWVYLQLPFRPMGKQMLIIARKPGVR